MHQVQLSSGHARADKIWVAIDESAVVGLGGLIVEKNEAEVEPLIVRHSHRRRGIGTQLLETVITAAQNLLIRYLNVRPVARNVVGLHFFHTRGFDTIGLIQLFMDMSQRSWKTGIILHNRQFNY
jgi:GNAT superfamily N-acetyltransferase